MKKKLLIIGLASVFTVVLIAAQPRGSSGTGEPDARIVAKLSEIVSIRERLARSYEEAVAAGRAQVDGLPEIELAEARIELARERGQSGAVVTELQKLVAVHERRMSRIANFSKDRMASGEMERAQAALLEAQVRLLRAQK